MSNHQATDFLAGVIEGFYGQPWSYHERLELFARMGRWGLNTYLYAPKDDLKQRAIWREPYSDSEAANLQAVIEACRQRELRFIYAVSPGLDMRYSKDSDLESLQRRFQQMLDLGCRHFALLFDDIPDRVDPQDLKRWPSLSAAQSSVANAMFRWTRDRSPDGRFLFCPTPYCGRMAERRLGGEGYLATIGRELLPEIDVFWTGPEIISRSISADHIRELQTVLRRKPLIWDNLHANDYDGRRFYCGPYAGRPLGLRDEVSGLLCNPNSEFPLNYVPLRTLAQFVHCQGAWDARQAYLSAMREWWPHFDTVGPSVDLDDLILFGDSYYLPHEEGPEGEAFYQQTRLLLASHPRQWGEQGQAFQKRASRLREFCARLAELRDRPLFYALSRRIWELREELDLLEKYVACQLSSLGPPSGGERTLAPGPAGQHWPVPGRSDFHLPGTYRGGLVARLQRLLIQHSDETFTPSPSEASARSSNDAPTTGSSV